MKPSAERLREVLSYRPHSGVLTFRVFLGAKAAGSIAGTLNQNGYRQVQIDGCLVSEHQIIWCWMLGEYAKRIDHKDRVRSNNRWRNLRLATSSQNGANSNVRQTNTSGFTGVSWNKRAKKWKAYIRVDYKRRDIGLFASAEAANDARMVAAKAVFGEYVP